MSQDANKTRIAEAVETLTGLLFDDKLAAMDSKIESLNENMKDVKSLLVEQEKRQKLEFAISCSSLQEFKYSAEDGQKTSGALVEKILRWFALGYGFHLPANATVGSSSKSESQKEELFRAKLTKQLENLIGHKPRLKDNGKGNERHDQRNQIPFNYLIHHSICIFLYVCNHNHHHRT